MSKSEIEIHNKAYQSGDDSIEFNSYLSGYRKSEEDAKQEKVAAAVKTLVEALNEDEGYRMSWQANIAMAFKDEHDNGEHQSLHDVANNGAKRFLMMLTRDVR